MAGYRPSYTVDEDIQILKAIIESKLYYSLRGRSFWKDLSAVGYLDRTWMSLQNRFEKSILPNISNPRLDVPKLEKRKIELGWHQTSAVFKSNYKKNVKNIDVRDENSSSSEEIDVESSSVEQVGESSSEDEIVIDDTDKPEKNLDANNKQIAKDAGNESTQNSDDSLVFALNTTITMLEEKVDNQTTQLDNTNVSKSNLNDFTTFMESETEQINNNHEHEIIQLDDTNVTTFKEPETEQINNNVEHKTTNEKSLNKKLNNFPKHDSDNKMQEYEITDDEGDIFLTCNSQS